MNAQLKEIIIFFDLLVMVYTSMGLALLLEGCKVQSRAAEEGKRFSCGRAGVLQHCDLCHDVLYLGGL